MVAVQVANGNVIYPHHADSTMPERDLRAFAAVQQNCFSWTLTSWAVGLRPGSGNAAPQPKMWTSNLK